MSEVLCTCWGSIQHSLSQRDHTDLLCRGGVVKFLSGASRICCCCHSSKPQAFHFVWMRISYLRDNTKQICDITQTQPPMNTEERSQAEYKMPEMSLTNVILRQTGNWCCSNYRNRFNRNFLLLRCSPLWAWIPNPYSNWGHLITRSI